MSNNKTEGVVRKIPKNNEIKRLNQFINAQDKEIKRLRAVINKYAWLMEFFDELKLKLNNRDERAR